MNKRQKIVQEAFLNNEEAVIKRLKQVYNQSLKDITAKTKALQDQINTLDALEGMTSEPEELAKLQSMKQAKVYQKQYQDALKKQVNSILDNMQVEEFKTVSEYLNKCYEEGFLGTMYDLQGQGIPLFMPMDQEAMVRAVQLDSKISQGLYTRLGEDVALLKKKITAQVSRGISTGMTFQQVAKQLESYTNIGFNNAVRIARTEGHRIQVQSGMDACYKAKEKGADVVKQWDATLDGSTRPSHQKVDGEIRELDEKFSNGLMFAGDPSGGAAEVVNCRCALLQRAKWALDEAELETLKERAEFFGLNKNDSFEDFKKKYLKAVEDIEKNPKKVYDKGEKRFDNFKNMDTIEEVKQYAKDKLHISLEDFDKVNIDVANMFVNEVGKFYDVFGDLHKAGHLNGIRVYPKKSSWYAAYSPPWKEVFVKNVKAKNSMAKMLKDAKEQVGFGFWSNAAAEQTIRHELGHAVQHMFTDVKAGNPFGNSARKLKEIEALRKEVMQECGITKWSVKDTEEHMKKAGSIISYYGLKDNGEFIAESVAEYMGGNPRETARKVVEILLGGD